MELRDSGGSVGVYVVADACILRHTHHRLVAGRRHQRLRLAQFVQPKQASAVGAVIIRRKCSQKLIITHQITWIVIIKRKAASWILDLMNLMRMEIGIGLMIDCVVVAVGHHHSLRLHHQLLLRLLIIVVDDGEVGGIIAVGWFGG